MDVLGCCTQRSDPGSSSQMQSGRPTFFHPTHDDDDDKNNDHTNENNNNENNNNDINNNHDNNDNNNNNNNNLHSHFLQSLLLFGFLPLLLVSLCPDLKQNEEDNDLFLEQMLNTQS